MVCPSSGREISLCSCVAVRETCWQCCQAGQALAGRVYRLWHLRSCSLVSCKSTRGFCQMKRFCSMSVGRWKHLWRGAGSPTWKPVMEPATVVCRGRKEWNRDARHPSVSPELRFCMFSNITAQGRCAKLGPYRPGGRAEHGEHTGARVLQRSGGC